VAYRNMARHVAGRPSPRMLRPFAASWPIWHKASLDGEAAHLRTKSGVVEFVLSA